jgi:hypothetical protein
MIMSLHCCRWFVAILISLTFVIRSVAQETTAETESSAADSEKTYHDLRRSKNRATKGAADRYFYLVRAQEWTSLNGKSKIIAKYVAHDPDLKWVKLSTVKGAGQNRVTREITVDVAKLNKACQSRVKQIDTLQKKLDELKVKEEKDESEQAGGGGRNPAEYGEPMRDERGAEPEQPAETPAGEPGSGQRGGETGDGGYEGYSPRPAAPGPARATPPADSSDPDPLGFDEITNEPPPAATADPRGIYGPSPTSAGEGERGGQIDRSQWKTNYAAFVANFTATPVEGGEPTIDWGELDELRSIHDAVALNPGQGVRDRYGRPAAKTAQPLIEVRWEAPFSSITMDPSTPELQFDLPQLPEPLKLRFLLDITDSPEVWSAMQANQKVAFIGRLEVQQPHEIIVRVRLAE